VFSGKLPNAQKEFQLMKYRVYYLDEPSSQDIIVEAANPRAAAQQLFSERPRNERCCIRVQSGILKSSMQDFDAVQFMDESARASLPPEPPAQSSVRGDASSYAPRQEEIRRVVVTDIDMRFQSMVFFMVKWAFATIPAIIIICVIVMIAFALFTGLVSHK